MDVLAGDADKVAGRAAGVRVKLGGDGEGLGGINGQSGAVVAVRSVKRQFTNTQASQQHRHSQLCSPVESAGIGVEAAAAGVAGRGRARVRSQSIGFRVALEDVHLVAAVARVVGVEGAVLPRLHGALGIAVAASIVGTSSVVLVGTTVGSHLREIERAILATRQS